MFLPDCKGSVKFCFFLRDSMYLPDYTKYNLFPLQNIIYIFMCKLWTNLTKFPFNWYLSWLNCVTFVRASPKTTARNWTNFNSCLEPNLKIGVRFIVLHRLQGLYFNSKELGYKAHILNPKSYTISKNQCIFLNNRILH